MALPKDNILNQRIYILTIMKVYPMKTLSFKAKILSLVLAPLIFVSSALTLLAIYQATELGERNLTTFAKQIYNLRRNELKNYTEMALTSVEHIYNSKYKDDPTAQETAKTILRNLAYGSDGYILSVVHYESTTLILFILFPLRMLSHWMNVSAAILAVSLRANPAKLFA